MNEQQANELVRAYQRRRELANVITNVTNSPFSDDETRPIRVMYGSVKFAMPLDDFVRVLTDEIKTLEAKFDLED
ncbi:hypothetical protein ATX51_09935 [Oenococcus oeni]|nr:hypothetical protein ATX51_09935 [Oenococcus oeni]